jgi:hypothetical protein
MRISSPRRAYWGGEYLRRRRDPRQSAFVDGKIEFFWRCPGFHFDKNDCFSPSRHQIDLTSHSPLALGEYAIAFEPQTPCRKSFSAAPDAFGLGAAHSPALSAIARS